MDTFGDFKRISQNPSIMGGKPCIKGTRITVARVVAQIGVGQSIESLLKDYPALTYTDVLEALRYAAWLAEEREIELVQV
ncbi:MAG: DUF433 domain-containing protein [Coriobacteriales bacterium]|jgi:uncharacterized protein (DUF433 family)|nr:DUF433 domain-containing protein [Coriobacteriales bacterium]